MKKIRAHILFLFVAIGLTACTGSPKKQNSEQPQLITNPIIDGYFADPCVIKDGDTFYIYATIDPWGGDELAVFSTKDFLTFDRHHLNWPTKTACTSPSSNSSMVWAPSVRKAANGKYYMYVSVGSEIWAGVSDSPLGPWKNAKEDDSPLVAAADFPKVHNIDADCFIDDDGQAYLYWGSGFHWINGICMAAKLNPDMITFREEPIDVTPPDYFEAPYMIKRFGKYYLMYSSGKAIDATYKVGYAVGNLPLGPFETGVNSPILETSADSTTYGPGHHSVFREGNQDYMLYHRIFPQDSAYVLRQLCVDSLNFDVNLNILKVRPSGVANF
ncbi:family 43 glycosylhydrolase [Mangrovibacterium diazotrophicum]|uniref:Glycosyl hydrolase family 43 n=1 Tax=Mangrovibacterium diazotrophicum TaxID=1261403 RepID=A0A419W5Q8_9BACT|nr:family 43 glycosylhydrolase [Mangrovibacterium diazotrophicum]RKD90798.1 glycosyl hydrolase family 43 [Mangrovibacterium diazotrophicum]